MNIKEKDFLNWFSYFFLLLHFLSYFWVKHHRSCAPLVQRNKGGKVVAQVSSCLKSAVFVIAVHSTGFKEQQDEGHCGDVGCNVQLGGSGPFYFSNQQLIHYKPVRFHQWHQWGFGHHLHLPRWKHSALSHCADGPLRSSADEVAAWTESGSGNDRRCKSSYHQIRI